MTVVRLCGMHQERMTEIDRAGIAGGRDDRPMRTRHESVGSELAQRQPLFSRGRKLTRDVRVRTDANAGWRVVFADVGEQK